MGKKDKKERKQDELRGEIGEREKKSMREKLDDEKTERRKGPQAAVHLSYIQGSSDHWSKKLPSIGTAKHLLGQCRPCIDFEKRQCTKGLNCRDCHARVHLK